MGGANDGDDGGSGMTMERDGVGGGCFVVHEGGGKSLCLLRLLLLVLLDVLRDVHVQALHQLDLRLGELRKVVEHEHVLRRAVEELVEGRRVNGRDRLHKVKEKAANLGVGLLEVALDDRVDVVEGLLEHGLNLQEMLVHLLEGRTVAIARGRRSVAAPRRRRALGAALELVRGDLVGETLKEGRKHLVPVADHRLHRDLLRAAAALPRERDLLAQVRDLLAADLARGHDEALRVEGAVLHVRVHHKADSRAVLDLPAVVLVDAAEEGRGVLGGVPADDALVGVDLLVEQEHLLLEQQVQRRALLDVTLHRQGAADLDGAVHDRSHEGSEHLVRVRHLALLLHLLEEVPAGVVVEHAHRHQRRHGYLRVHAVHHRANVTSLSKGLPSTPSLTCLMRTAPCPDDAQ
eukprot:Rhum_TRINITY_DN15264_c3_g4::Rhum_TRINITY_DN15264_c3_g4_i1::g.149130::m.149130